MNECATFLRARAYEVLRAESEVIASLKDSIDEDFINAVEMLGKMKGKLIIAGMGKSGHIARKMASTFASTGTPALFLHPAESSHGDLGVIGEEDIILLISYSGNSKELLALIRYAIRRNIPLIAMSGKRESLLGESARFFIHIKVEKEACPLGLAPTSSTTATLALGDALAMCLLEYRGFRKEDFAELHPGGSLGVSLVKVRKVHELMHTGDRLPLLPVGASMGELLSMMTYKDLRGIAGIVDEKGNLVGVVTDGDLRRYLEKGPKGDFLQESIEELMNTNPKVIASNELVERALFLMENFSIQALFVVEALASSPSKSSLLPCRPLKPVGVIHFQDLLKNKVS